MKHEDVAIFSTHLVELSEIAGWLRKVMTRADGKPGWRHADMLRVSATDNSFYPVRLTDQPGTGVYDVTVPAWLEDPASRVEVNVSQVGVELGQRANQPDAFIVFPAPCLRTPWLNQLVEILQAAGKDYVGPWAPVGLKVVVGREAKKVVKWRDAHPEWKPKFKRTLDVEKDPKLAAQAPDWKLNPDNPDAGTPELAHQ